MTFQKAKKTKVKLRLALTGPSGSGKTMSALFLASGLGKKIALIDTENGSASLYSDRFDFDTLQLSAPYTISKYIQAILAAEQAGYDVIIVDSLSHAWAGEGGLLSKKEALDSRGGNSFANWGAITKEQEELKNRLLHSKIHLIVTIRSKQDYVLDANEKGKTTPRKVGLAPVQRDGIEYEFDAVFDLAMDHNAVSSKDRTSLFDGRVFKISQETGVELLQWLESGVEPATPGLPFDPKFDAPLPLCDLCGAMVVIHKPTGNYICPAARSKGDGHLRVLKDTLQAQQMENTNADSNA